MLFNENLRKLFDIMELDPDEVFKGGLGVYKQQQAEEFMKSIVSDAYSEGEDNAAADTEGEIEDACEEAMAEAKEDIANYVEYHLYKDYKDAVEREGRPPIKEEFDLIKELILENI